MLRKNKILLLIFLLTFVLSLLLVLPVGASDVGGFKAEVIDIVAEQEKGREDGSVFRQQDLKLRGLKGDYQDKEMYYYGISEIEVASENNYKVGDKVFVDRQISEDGHEAFYIIDFVRSPGLYLLFAIFVAVVLLVGRFKGLKALLALAISFVVIIKLILPQILVGRDPFLVSLLGGVLILAILIYLTEGVKRKSHLAILAVLLSLFFTLVLSVVFVKLTRLSGLSQEEAVFLIGLGEAQINFQGLMLAGFIIGAIGVLDDIIIGQIEAVAQIRVANPSLQPRQLFKLAYKIGNTHLGAIINTLFLTYAGAALPLLLLFVINQGSGLGFDRLINTDVISTEIVRTLVGSIGVILSMPIATALAVFWGRKID